LILRDPVHGLVVFDGAAGSLVEALLATREVQRLRHIRQLGLTSYVFPGGEHSRFAHAIGSAHVMVRLLNRLREIDVPLPSDQRIDSRDELDAIAAALLHDLGHGPFSHLFEQVMSGARSHEQWTRDAILDPRTEVHSALAKVDQGMPKRVADLLAGTHRLAYLARSVSGTLDVDRCDYLLRDSHMTGVKYGVFDLEWLLRALTLGQVATPPQWGIAIEGRKGMPPIESFFLARHFMYEQVYHHKATQAAESLVRAILTRVQELVVDGAVDAFAPAAIVAAARQRPVDLADYFELDDVGLLGAFRRWAGASDPTLARLSTDVLARRFPKTFPLPTMAGARERWPLAFEAARSVVEGAGLRADLHLRLDVPSDVPYAEPTDERADGLWVLMQHRVPTRLGDASFLLGELRNKRIERPRLIFPGALREPIVNAVEAVFR
jgi:hypothetical protein